MKKLALVAVFALVFTFCANVALAEKPSTSWQEWYGYQNRLVVYTDNNKTAICFDGKREDYDGGCVSPSAPASEYEAKRKAIQDGAVYVDQAWIDYYAN